MTTQRVTVTRAFLMDREVQEVGKELDLPALLAKDLRSSGKVAFNGPEPPLPPEPVAVPTPSIPPNQVPLPPRGPARATPAKPATPATPSAHGLAAPGRHEPSHPTDDHPNAKGVK